MDGLTTVIIPNSVTEIEAKTFQDCEYLSSITIPNSITSIGSYAFDDCFSLKSVSIPASVTSIANQSFNCDYLRDVYCYAEEAPKIESEAFVPWGGRDIFLEQKRSTLHVSSPSNYRGTLPWGAFGKIVPLTDEEIIANDIEEVDAPSMFIQSNGNVLEITGLEEGQKVAVYNMGGMLVGNSIATNGTVTISTNLNSGEIAVVKIGKKSVKVVVK